MLAERAPGEQRLFRIVERDELDHIGAAPDVHFALAAAQGVVFSASTTRPAIDDAEGGTHGFFPTDFPEIYTGFVGWGAGFRPGAVAPLMGLEDIAPLVAELLGIELEAPDGVLRPGLLAPRAVQTAEDR